MIRIDKQTLPFDLRNPKDFGSSGQLEYGNRIFSEGCSIGRWHRFEESMAIIAIGRSNDV